MNTKLPFYLIPISHAVKLEIRQCFDIKKEMEKLIFAYGTGIGGIML